MANRAAQAGKLIRELVNVNRVLGVQQAGVYAVQILKHFPEIARVGVLAPADASMRERSEYWARYRGLELLLPGSMFMGIREMYGRDVYLWPHGDVIGPGSIVVDLGCNAGLFTLYSAKRGARVVAVDAQSGFERDLMDNLARNGCAQNVKFICALIGTKAGVFSDEEALKKASHFGRVPPVMQMDAMLAANAIADVDFMKIDIEGAEFDLLSAPAPWLDRVRAMSIEVHAQHGRPSALARTLRGRGFQLTFTDNDRRPLPEDVDGRDGYLFARRA